MPKTLVLPTARSGYEKFRNLLGKSFRTDVTHESGFYLVKFEVRKSGDWFSSMSPLIAKVWMRDTSVTIEIYDNAFRNQLEDVSKAFESGDTRKVDVNVWE